MVPDTTHAIDIDKKMIKLLKILRLGIHSNLFLCTLFIGKRFLR